MLMEVVGWRVVDIVGGVVVVVVVVTSSMQVVG